MTKTEKIRRAIEANPTDSAGQIAGRVGASTALVYQVKHKLPKSLPRHLPPSDRVSLATLTVGQAFLNHAGGLEVARAVLDALAELGVN